MGKLKEKFESIVFEQEGKKKTISKKLMRRASISFGLLGILAILIEEPKRTIKKATEFTSSQNVGSRNLNSIPDHKTSETKRPTKLHQAQPVKLPGPTTISRPGANEILPGTIVKAVLQTSATDGPVKAVLIEDVVVSGEVKISSGSMLIGVGQSLESRVGIQFLKAIVNEREVLEISAVALDSEDQLVGLQASRLGSESVRLGASVGLNFVGGLAEGMKERTGVNGASVEQNTTSNALLNGAAHASLEQARSLMESTKNQKVSLMVDSGTPIFLFFNGSK
ncbi:MAG: hypothetical protein B7Y39_04590 [Bdellovibrio sp. 28-41-41]|nr:MAG: hypothetical protein B7Y39_04590 [Bdellovibrio sp. 28-41-41]